MVNKKKKVTNDVLSTFGGLAPRPKKKPKPRVTNINSKGAGSGRPPKPPKKKDGLINAIETFGGLAPHPHPHPTKPKATTKPKVKATPRRSGPVAHPFLTAVRHAITKSKPSSKGSGSKGSGGGGGASLGGGGGNVIGGQSIPGLGGTSVGQPMDPSLADAGAHLFDASLAEKLANQQYDPQIQVLHNQQGQQHADAAQAMHDIQHWYGDVIGSQGVAAQRDAQAGSRATADVGNAAAAILSSLGGSANQGASVIAGQGLNDTNTQAALAQAENQYQNDLTPLLKDEQAGASRAEQARQSKLAAELSNQLLQLVGEKGAARTQNTMNIQGMNNDILDKRLGNLMNIKQYNNSLGQQNFQNRLSAHEAALAAAMTGAQVKAYGASTGGNGFTPWAKLDPSQRNDLINAAVGNAMDQYGGLAGDPVNAWNIARQYLTGQGYTSAKKGVNNKAHTQMGAMIDAALQHAIAINRRRAQLAQQ